MMSEERLQKEIDNTKQKIEACEKNKMFNYAQTYRNRLEIFEHVMNSPDYFF